MYRLLIPAGLNINQGYSYRSGPLLYAISTKDNELVKFLLENGAEPERNERSGMTVLGVTLYHNAGVGFIEQLIEHGANTRRPGLLAKAAYSG